MPDLAAAQRAVLAAAATAALALAAAGGVVLGVDASLIWLILALVLTVPAAMQREFGEDMRSRICTWPRPDPRRLGSGAAARRTWLAGIDRQIVRGRRLRGARRCLRATSLVWLYCARSNFVIRADQVRQATRESWGLGKWLCAGQITVTMQGYASYWLLPVLSA